MWACCLLSNFNLLALYCQNVFNSEVTGKNTYELNVVSTGTNTSNVLVIDRNEVQRVALISEGQDPKLSAPQKQRCALYSSLEHRNTYVGEKKIKKNLSQCGPFVCIQSTNKLIVLKLSERRIFYRSCRISQRFWPVGSILGFAHVLV